MFFTYILQLCMQVPEYRHYLILMHPMSKQETRMKYVSANLQFDISNCNLYRDDAESYYFELTDKQPHQDIYRPKFSKPSDCFNIVGNPYSQEISKKMLASFFSEDSIGNMYYVYYARTAKGKIPSFNSSSFVNGKRGSQSIYLVKDYPSVLDIQDLEDLLYEAIVKAKSAEKNRRFLESVFDYDSEKMRTTSISIMTHKNICNASVVKNVSGLPYFFRQLTTLFAPYDITKAGYKFYIFSESVDSVTMTLNFDENVDLSPCNRPYNKQGKRSFLFDNLATRALEGLPNEPFLWEINTKYGRVNAEKYQRCANRDYISLWAKFEASERLQWIRLFFLTSLLAYFITQLLSIIISLAEYIMKNIKIERK